jgi:hypothetical protein
LIRRKGTEGGGVAEEERDVSQLPDGRIVLDGVGIVEVKAVLKVICVCDAKDRDQQKAAGRDSFLTDFRSQAN